MSNFELAEEKSFTEIQAGCEDCPECGRATKKAIWHGDELHCSGCDHVLAYVPGAFDMTAPTPAPETSLVVQETITKKHVEIGDELLARTRNLINSGRGKIMNYAVSRSRGSWDTNDETITMDFGDECSLVIVMKTKEKKLDS
jgi:hypothetical protein